MSRPNISLDDTFMKNLSKKYKFDLLLLNKDDLFTNVKITKYYYFYLDKDIKSNYYFKSTKPYNKFKIFYLIF